MASSNQEKESMDQAKHLALLYAQAHTKTSYITCDSKYGNLILPVVPRTQEGKLDPKTQGSSQDNTSQ